MGFGARLHAICTDPPMRDRLIWRGLREPAPRDHDDSAVLASAFGALYAFGGALGLLAMILGDPVITDAPVMAAAAGAAIAIGLVCLIGYRRLPRIFFHFAATAGIAIITAAAFASEAQATAIYAPFYAFVVMICLLLLSPGTAALQVGFALAAYAIALYARGTDWATHLLLASLGMLLSLGMLIAVVRTRRTRIEGELSFGAYTDQLTGIANRRNFDERFELEIERARRQGGSLSLVICDLDHFKQINDEHGHDIGDVVLQRAARAIEATVRSVDLAARIGGEEFGLILPGADPEQAARAAERVRHGIREEFGNAEPRLTASCGISSTIGEGADRSHLFSAADRALYAAKRAGRDCTAIASGEEIKFVGGGSAVGRLRASLGS
jgi:diguanylate cyclase (GGDEF)-like protein